MLSKNLVKKSGLYFIGNISTKLLSFILLPVYAYYVTTNDFGNYDLMNTFANLVAPIIFISIWDGVLKSLLDNNTSDKNSILSTAYILAFIVFTLITLIMMLYFMICGIDNFILGVYIITISFSFLSLWQYSARGLKANNAYVIASACSAIINFIFSIFMLVVLKLGIKSLLLATAIGSFTGIVIIEFRVKILKRITKNKFNKDILYQMTKYSVPLVVNAIAGWGILSVCRIIISYKLGTEMNGIYSYATKFNQLIMIFGQIFNMAWLEESIMSIRTKGASEYFSNSIKSISRIILGILIIGGPMVGLYYQLIADTEYSQAINIFPILLIVPVIQTISTNVGCIFQASGKTNIIFYTTIFGALTTVLVSILFINSFGLISVAFAQLLGMLVMLISRKIITNNIFRVDIEPIIIIKSISYYIILTYISIFSGIIIKVLIIIVSILIAITINKSNIIQIKNMILNKSNISEDIKVE